MAQSNSDRREFFRINDTVVIELQPVEKDRVGEVAERISHSSENDTSSDRAQLRTMQNVFSHLLDQISQHDREVARALRLLDDKLNLIAEKIVRNEHPINPEKLTDVNLSGGGVALMVADPIPARDYVELFMQLVPSASTVHTLATVISCDKITSAPTETPYLLRMAFTHMDEIDRNHLIRHTLKRQAERIRDGEFSGAMSLVEN